MKNPPFSKTTLLTLFLTLSLAITDAALAQNSPPLADAGEDHNVLVDESVVLNGSATDPNGNMILDWLWTIESQPPGSSPYLSREDIPDPEFSGDVPGDYVLSLTAIAGDLRSERDFVTVHVEELLPPVARADADFTSGHAPLTVQFDGSASTAGPLLTLESYEWDFGDDTAPSFEVAPVHAYCAGVYTATLQVFDDLGQTHSSTIRITVCREGGNCPPMAHAGADQTILVDQSTALSGTATDPDDDDIAKWDWMIVSQPPGSSPSFPVYYIADPTFQAYVAGDYVLSLRVKDTEGSDWSEPDYVTVHVIENLPPVAVANTDITSGYGPLTVNFDGTSSYDLEGEELYYLWQFGDDSPDDATPSPTHVYESPGTYTVRLTVWDDREQIGDDSILITVEEPCPDMDGDTVCDDEDNCPNTPNPGQEDADGDGVGEACQRKPTIRGIIEFFHDSVEAGTIEGRGRGRLARFRCLVMGWMLEKAARCIERDRTTRACRILKRLYKRCDGKGRTWWHGRDLIKGDATEKLASMIQEITVSLGC